MATTNTAFDWYWYIRKKGKRYYLGLVDNNGDDATAAYDIEIFYDEVPDDLDEQDDVFPLPAQFELGFAKGIAAELMGMSDKKELDIVWMNKLERAYNKTVDEAIHFQIKETQQPIVIKPFDLRDD